MIAESLLEHETIDGKHILEIIEHGEIRSPILKREIPVDQIEEAEEEDEVPKKPAKQDDDTAVSLGRKLLRLLNYFLLRLCYFRREKHWYLPPTWKRVSLIR